MLVQFHQEMEMQFHLHLGNKLSAQLSYLKNTISKDITELRLSCPK